MVDRNFWRHRRVFVTGHTGFKGGWLATWLIDMGAKVYGFALAPETEPSYFKLCDLDRRMHSTIADIRDIDALAAAMGAAQPEIVFHLAAQPLVRRSYREPTLTFAINVMGTAHVLEAVRGTSSVRAVVIITSDKCYENREWPWGYREVDQLGGHDPYSASKACAEMVCSAYRRSFFEANGHQATLATVRAGNVIGGGDWSEDRIIPDAVKAFSVGDPLPVRNPQAVRPWQHVLEPLAGYLVLAEHLVREGAKFAGAWNFGPAYEDAKPVSVLVEAIARNWGGGARWQNAHSGCAPHESLHLMLDTGKAQALLNWRSQLRLDEAIAMTVEWYRQALACESVDMNNVSRAQILQYEDRQEKNL